MTLDKNDAMAIAAALHAAEAEVGTDSPAMKALHDLLYRLAIKYKNVLGLTSGDVTTMSGGDDKEPTPDGPPK